MNRDEALKRISKVVAGQLSLDEGEIQESSSFTAWVLIL
jgi:acyl carrier protein